MAQGQHIDRAGVMVPTKAKLLMASSVGHKGEKMVSFTHRTARCPVLLLLVLNKIAAWRPASWS